MNISERGLPLAGAKIAQWTGKDGKIIDIAISADPTPIRRLFHGDPYKTMQRVFDKNIGAAVLEDRKGKVFVAPLGILNAKEAALSMIPSGGTYTRLSNSLWGLAGKGMMVDLSRNGTGERTESRF